MLYTGALDMITMNRIPAGETFKGYSRSWQMTRFDRQSMTPVKYKKNIVIMAVSRIVFEIYG